MSPAEPRYQRTLNPGGTHATRCLYCMMPLVTTAESAAELDPIEARHLCPERVLADQNSLPIDAEPAPPRS